MPIILEQVTVVKQESFENEQYILQLYAPEIATQSQAGQFIHLQCSNDLLMRRPYSIMSANDDGIIEVLYKVVGEGSRQLSERVVEDTLSCLGPIGNGFQLTLHRRIILLIGGGVGIPPIVFLANQAQADGYQPIVLMGSEIGFPYTTVTSEIAVSGCDDNVNLAMQALEEKGIASRLATQQGIVGCYDGYLNGLLAEWFNTTDIPVDKVEIFACGPHVMLDSIANVARQFKVPCQVALEEYMACAVGGCAGCTIPVKRDGEVMMKRVCVDGPVFQAKEVFWNQ